MSSIFGEWVQWRVGAIKSVDPNHLITVGHNALHGVPPRDPKSTCQPGCFV